MNQKNHQFTSFWLQAELEQEKEVNLNLKNSILQIMERAHVNIYDGHTLSGKLNDGSQLIEIKYKFNISN